MVLVKQLRTLVLNLGLRKGFQAGRNDFPQGSFLAPDGGGGHEREKVGFGFRGRKDRETMSEN